MTETDEKAKQKCKCLLRPDFLIPALAMFPSIALRVTISIGIAESMDESRRTTVLNEADTRLYRAKNEGRNRVVS